MIDLQLTNEEELTPRCMALPSKVYSIEVTEDILFEPTPKRVHLFSRSDGDNNTMPPLYFWETVTPFGGFDAKYLHSEYPGKLFRVLDGEELFLVRVPGRDRELGTTATTTVTPATTAATTSIIANLTTSSMTTSSNRSIITQTATTTTVLTPVNVRRATNVWTLETVPPIVGLSFCLLILLTLYVRRVWPAGGCCMCICRWLAARRRRRNNRKNDDIELTNFEERASTSSDADDNNTNTTTASSTTNLSFASFVNVALEEDD